MQVNLRDAVDRPLFILAVTWGLYLTTTIQGLAKGCGCIQGIAGGASQLAHVAVRGVDRTNKAPLPPPKTKVGYLALPGAV